MFVVPATTLEKEPMLRIYAVTHSHLSNVADDVIMSPHSTGLLSPELAARLVGAANVT
jgi:hypothetical protein